MTSVGNAAGGRDGGDTGAFEAIVRVRIQGRVQGVGYRAFTHAEASALGLIGWVRNRRNGDVEAVFAGRVEAIEALCILCRRGPPAADVTALNIIEAERAALEEPGWHGGFQQLATF